MEYSFRIGNKIDKKNQFCWISLILLCMLIKPMSSSETIKELLMVMLFVGFISIIMDGNRKSIKNLKHDEVTKEVSSVKENSNIHTAINDDLQFLKVEKPFEGERKWKNQRKKRPVFTNFRLPTMLDAAGILEFKVLKSYITNEKFT